MSPGASPSPDASSSGPCGHVCPAGLCDDDLLDSGKPECFSCTACHAVHSGRPWPSPSPSPEQSPYASPSPEGYHPGMSPGASPSPDASSSGPCGHVCPAGLCDDDLLDSGKPECFLCTACHAVHSGRPW